MKKSVEKIWNDVIGRKAIAINETGCSIIGETALWYSPYGNWKVCYLNKFEAYHLLNGEVKRSEFD